ncbi:MAG TPA: ethanolamine ammonia-lyase reactivating factor EutA [Candidatus Dormibacteraeota bacterium]
MGVDIGSSTSHLLFSRLLLERLAQSLSSRFVVVEREVLQRSAILLTPFSPDGLIDAEALERFVTDAYAAAGLSPEQVDTGAVILTGLALDKPNARAIADLFARVCGGFVCASAGHHLEAILAAHGSGAVRRSRDRPECTWLHVDAGGGTTKLALIGGGEVVSVAALEAGGRRSEPVGEMVEAIVGAAAGDRVPELVTAPLAVGSKPDFVTFSGGVAEYIYGRETRRFGDAGPELGAALLEAARTGRFGGALDEPAVGIRATVTGASQFTVQLSGNTVHVAAREVLPLRNLPVVDARAGAGTGAIPEALRRLDLVEGEQPLAVALRWEGEPRYSALRELAAALAAALPRTLAAGVPLVLALDADVGRSLGAVLTEEFAPSAQVIALDGLDVQELDFIDVGNRLEPAGVVPVVVKSLAF